MNGLARRDDPDTSHTAAASVRRSTIRDAVIAFAKAAGPGGFIDHDLRAIDPNAPESSLRKRRSELTKEGILINTGNTRTNDNGVSAFIWKHRDHTADKQNVFIGSAATSPLTEAGLRKAVEFAHSRKAKAVQKIAASVKEDADADLALSEAMRDLDNWLNRDQMVLL